MMQKENLGKLVAMLTENLGKSRSEGRGESIIG